MLDFIRGRSQSLVIKLVFGIIIIVFVFWGVGNLSGTSSGALAVVNGENISVKDFADQFRSLLEQERRRNPGILHDENALKQLKANVLNAVIASRLLLQEAERLGMIVTPHELRAFIGGMALFQDDSGAFDPQRYKAILGSQNISPGSFEARYSEEILQAKLTRLVATSAKISPEEARGLAAFSLEARTAEYVLFRPENYAGQVNLTEEEIAQAYETGKEGFRRPPLADLEYLILTPKALAKGYPVSEEDASAYYEANSELFQLADVYLSRHIFLAAPPDESGDGNVAKIAEARKTAENIAQQLKDGADFAELARMYSQDTVSAENGGMLGWIEVGKAGSKEFDEAAFALAPGQTSEPVRTAMGFHIIRLEDKKQGGVIPFAEVKENIIAELARKKADADFSGTRKAAEDALVLNTPLAEIAQKFRTEVQETGQIPQSTALEILNLHSDSRAVLENALFAALSDSLEAASRPALPVPLDIVDGIALVRIKDVKPSIIPDLAEVREGIADRLRLDKGKELARTAAEEALPSFTGEIAPKGFKAAVQKTGGALLRASVAVEPELGRSGELVDSLFFSTNKAWLPKVHETEKGFVIARVASIEPLSGKALEEAGKAFLIQGADFRERTLSAALLRNLWDSAEIEVYYDRLDMLVMR